MRNRSALRHRADSSFSRRVIIAKNQNTYAKRQREAEKRAKAEEKRAKRLQRKESDDSDNTADDVGVAPESTDGLF